MTDRPAAPRPNILRRGGSAAIVVAATTLLGGGVLWGQVCDGCSHTTPAGGDTTLHNATSRALALPAPNLSTAQLAKHQRGDRAFDHQFVSAGNPVRGGLGPIFNADSCTSCHTGNGRGRPVDNNGNRTEQLFMRASAGHDAKTGAPTPLPGYGLQLQTSAIYGVAPEARVAIAYTPVAGRYADGTPFTLHKPKYTVDFLQEQPGRTVHLSPRLAPTVNGVGLLEAIPVERLRALADPDDANGDGISGKLQEIVDETNGEKTVGRFGWKALTPSVRRQTADAYQADMGLTSPARRTESSLGQSQDDDRADDPEIDETTLDETTFYAATLGVPARRNADDPAVKRGERLFDQPVAAGGADCAACHTPTQYTGPAERIAALLSTTFANDAKNPLADQTFHPYTDLLLHDMGPKLADGRTVFRASGREWRTPPLWGIGLTAVINGDPYYLHDGRAQSLAEAILWHGGEAKGASAAFRQMDAVDREALIAFLRSL